MSLYISWAEDFVFFKKPLPLTYGHHKKGKGEFYIDASLIKIKTENFKILILFHFNLKSRIINVNDSQFLY